MKTLAATFLLLVAACAGESTTRVTQTTPLRVPVTAKLVLIESTPGRTVLAARVERHVRFAADVAVSVTVPPGVLVVGPTDWVSPGAAVAGVDERTLEVQFSSIPPGDLELTASAQGTGFGLTARDSYRFGRAAPDAAPRVRSEGPHLVIGGVDYGASVPLGE